jgi:hypothetical protein
MKFVTTTFFCVFFVSAICLGGTADQAGDKLSAVAGYVNDANAEIIAEKIGAVLRAEGIHPAQAGSAGMTVSVPKAQASRAYVILAKLIKRDHLKIELVRLNKDGTKYERIEVDDALSGKIK